MSNDDKVFMKRFSGILLGLVAITIVIIVIANSGREDSGEDNNPSRITIADERTSPVGAARTEIPAAPAVTEVAASEAAPADPADIDGSAIYAQVCQACHMTGAAGAPKPASPEWAERASKGVDVLSASAINGIGAMPPKGGRMDISDAEVTAAVEFMLQQ